MARFFGALFDVAKDWDHEALSHLPGFRDRIAIIRLTDEEGGMNLNMPAERIARLAGYGRDAGREFARRFGNLALVPAGPLPDIDTGDRLPITPNPTPTMNWENHQRIRLRLLIASVAETLGQMLATDDRMNQAGMGYARFLERPPVAAGPIHGQDETRQTASTQPVCQSVRPVSASAPTNASSTLRACTGRHSENTVRRTAPSPRSTR